MNVVTFFLLFFLYFFCRRYVTLQRQKPQQPQELGTTKNYVLEEEGESEEQLADLETTTTSTSRPRVKVSGLLTSTPRILTSTRVVTQIVEGSTQRQRVPLHRLHELLPDTDNLIKSSTKSELSTQTSKKRISNRLIRKRPSQLDTFAISASATTEFPLNKRNQQIRPPLKERSESQNVTTLTKKRTQSLAHSRIRIRTNTSKELNYFNRKQKENNTRFHLTSAKEPEGGIRKEGIIPQQVSTAESSNTFIRNRFMKTRNPTDDDREDGKDPLLSREFSRESSIIRKPLFRYRSGTTSSQISKEDSTLSHTTPVSTMNTKNYSEVFYGTERKNTTIFRNPKLTGEKTNVSTFVVGNGSLQHDENPFTLKELPSSITSHTTTTSKEKIEYVEGNTTESVTSRTESVTPEYFNSTVIADAVQESNQLVPQTVKRNKTKRILRRKLVRYEKKNLTTLVPSTQSTSKERNRIKIIGRISNKKLEENRENNDSSTASTAQKKVTTSRGKTKYYQSLEQAVRNTERPKENISVVMGRMVLAVESSAKHQSRTLPFKHKRVLVRSKIQSRGNKKAIHTENGSPVSEYLQQTSSTLQKRENGKLRQVVLKKIVRDLAVGETGVPRSQENSYEIDNPQKSLISRGSIKLKESLRKEGMEFTETTSGNTSSEVGLYKQKPLAA